MMSGGRGERGVEGGVRRLGVGYAGVGWVGLVWLVVRQSIGRYCYRFVRSASFLLFACGFTCIDGFQHGPHPRS